LRRRRGNHAHWLLLGRLVAPHTAEKVANEKVSKAVVAVLAPICADKFRAMPDYAATHAALTKADSWKRSDQFPKELVTLPGESYPSSGLVDACYTLLQASKTSAAK
jgi:hypothetical protein